MFIISCEIKLHIPMAHSLKDKRRIIKSIMEKSKNKFNIAIAEVGENDLWQSSVIAFVSVSNDKKHLDSLVKRVINFIEGYSEIQLIEFREDWL